MALFRLRSVAQSGLIWVSMRIRVSDEDLRNHRSNNKKRQYILCRAYVKNISL